METLQLLSARVPVGDVTVVAEVPFAYADFQVVRDLNSLEVERIREFGFGNPYLGAEVQRGAVRYGVGVRAPLSTDAAAVVGFLADAERPQSTVQDFASATLSFDGVRPLPRGLRLRGHFAPTVLVYTGDGILTQSPSDPDPVLFDPDPWLAFSYGLMLDGELGQVRLSGGLAGYEETREGFGFGFVSARAGATVDAGLLRPGIAIRTKLSDNGPPKPVVGFSLDLRIQ